MVAPRLRSVSLLLALTTLLGGCATGGGGKPEAGPAPVRQMAGPAGEEEFPRGPTAPPEQMGRGGVNLDQPAGMQTVPTPGAAPMAPSMPAQEPMAGMQTVPMPGQPEPVAAQPAGSVTAQLALLERDVSAMRGEMEVLRHENRRLTEQLNAGQPVAGPEQGAIPQQQPGPGAGQPVGPPPAPNAGGPAAKETVVAVIPADEPGRSSPAIVKPAPVVPLAVASSNPKEAYDTAFAKLKEGQYDKALAGFTGFLQSHPSDDLAGNAQFWIGEIHYTERRYADALAAYNQVLVRYPKNDKVPGSLLKMGMAFHELEDLTNAKASLDRLITDYPNSPAVTQAKQRLKVIKEQMAKKR